MAIKPIIRMGDSRPLVSAPVHEFGAAAQLRGLITDMEDTMQGGGGRRPGGTADRRMLRVVIFGGGRTARYPEADAVP